VSSTGWEPPSDHHRVILCRTGVAQELARHRSTVYLLHKLVCNPSRGLMTLRARAVRLWTAFRWYLQMHLGVRSYDTYLLVSCYIAVQWELRCQ
jgi:hypothetical protein